MPTDLDTTLRLLAELAPALRDAGLSRVKVGDIELDLRPADPPAPLADDRDDKPYSSPLDDPRLYGRTGGRAPGFDPPTDE